MRVLLGLLVVLGLGCQCGAPAGTGDGGEGGGTASGGGTGTGGGGGTSTGGGTGTACIPGASNLVIAPATATVAAGQAQAFTASASVNSTTTDVTGQLSWTATRADDSPVGTFTGPGQLQAAAGVGGQLTVTATDGCLTATATLTVTLDATIAAGDGGVVVGDFSGTVDSTTTGSLPRVVYPHDGTRFPRNIYKVLFQWQRAGNARFRLTFTGPASTTTVLTDGVHPLCPGTANGCWEADAAAWLAIAGSNAGAEVQLRVDGVATPGATVFRGPAITLGFSRRDVKGAIFYWSTTSAGIRRATVSDSAPEPYLVGKPVPSLLDGGAVVQCVACHTVSRSGRKLVAGTKTSQATGLFVYDVTLTPPPVPLITTEIQTRDKGFGTFSPDDARVVATVGDKLVEFDVGSRQRVVELPLVEGTNPDWSPTGEELAYSNQGGDSPGGAALAVIARVDGGWGASRVLVPAGGLTTLFPSYAPDGKHLAYVRGKGGHGDKTFQLWLIEADGGTPTELLNANRKVNNCLGIACDGGFTNGQYENTMPTWAPPGDLDWVAFNSLRPYGVVFPSGGTQQLWVAAIDRSKVGQRQADGGLVDPSYPAFRFAFQDLNENNHRAFWTLDVRVEVDAGQPACVAAGQPCSANARCCAPQECQPTGELTFACQAPGSFDAGQCIPVGQACSQVSGAGCCDLAVCDVGADGGTSCQPVIQ